jgi:hypothetical protein
VTAGFSEFAERIRDAMRADPRRDAARDDRHPIRAAQLRRSAPVSDRGFHRYH